MPINPIQSLDIQALELVATPQTAWAPLANSSHVSGVIALPFGFTIKISEFAAPLSLVSSKAIVATLSPPKAGTVTTITSQTPLLTTASLALVLPQAPLTVGPAYSDHL